MKGALPPAHRPPSRCSEAPEVTGCSSRVGQRLQDWTSRAGWAGPQLASLGACTVPSVLPRLHDSHRRQVLCPRPRSWSCQPSPDPGSLMPEPSLSHLTSLQQPSVPTRPVLCGLGLGLSLPCCLSSLCHSVTSSSRLSLLPSPSLSPLFSVPPTLPLFFGSSHRLLHSQGEETRPF